MKYFSALLIPAVLSLSGCTNLFPKPEQFTPPSESSDVAKIRLIGPPMSYALYQTDSSGKKTGGWILKHNAYLNPFLGSTKDIGLPKITGKQYKEDYVETLLVPDEKTIIHHSLYQGCKVNLPFVPEKKKIYEAHISYGDKTGYCVLYLKEVALDSINGIYVEKELSK